MKILIINGPNMNLLGLREPQIYGRRTYSDLVGYINAFAAAHNTECEFFQSNHEGAIVDEIQSAYGIFDGIVINPAAYTHTSIAIPDALRAVGIPAVEVHISDISSREEYRKISYTCDACIATVSGKGLRGYTEAITILLQSVK